MVLNKLLLVISTQLCLSVVISAVCPQSRYTNSEGKILSPGFNTSESYGTNMTCTYNIHVQAGRRIILEFKTLSLLGTMPDCAEDSVEIIVGCSNTSIGKFCSCSNLSMPDKIYSYDNCMTLVFKSDGSKQGKGFEAHYTTADNNATKLVPSSNCSTEFVTASHGTIFTPNWPLKYPHSDFCVWKFDPSQTRIVRFFFTSFLLDEDPVCKLSLPLNAVDYISINGTNTTNKQVTIEERLCKMPEKASFLIEGMKSIEVRFGSNGEPVGDLSGVMAGYASYENGTLDSSAPGCKYVAPTIVSTPTTGPSTTSSTTEGPTTEGPTTKGGFKLSGGEIAGITIGTVAGLALIAGLCYGIYIYCCKTKTPATLTPEAEKCL